MKKLLSILTISMVVILSGCFIKGDTEITLYVDDEVYDVFRGTIGHEIVLDIPTKEGMMFTGWEHEDGVDFDEVVISSNPTFYATWEDPSEVFEVVEHMDGEGYIVITEYTGDSKYMRIPAYIDGEMVLELGHLSFEDSEVEIMQLPMDTRVLQTPFVNSSIKRVEFYGEYLDYTEVLMGQTEYDELINDYPTCTIESGSVEDGSWVFAEGCPIIEVTDKQDVVILDEVYSTYTTIINRNIYLQVTSNQIGAYAFQEAYMLEELLLPNSPGYLFSSMIQDCTEFESFNVYPENLQYSTDETGSLYNKSKDKLVIYPTGSINHEYVLPIGVTSIAPDAFMPSTNLRTLIIHSEFTNELSIVGAKYLEEIIVDVENDEYYSIDGVLYNTDDELLKYPPSKLDTSFEVPAETTKIARYAFQYNKYLERITINEGLESIGEMSFAETESLIELDLPGSVKSIGLNALQLSSIDVLIVRRDVETYGDITEIAILLRTDKLYEGFEVYIPDSSWNDYTALMPFPNENNGWQRLIGNIKLLSEYQE